MSYFIACKSGWIEVDYTKKGYVPMWCGRAHPDPQHWHDIRKAALNFYDWRCCLCYDHRDFLEVHHRTYLRWGRERLIDVVVLCAECHALFHKERRLAV